MASDANEMFDEFRELLNTLCEIRGMDTLTKYSYQAGVFDSMIWKLLNSKDDKFDILRHDIMFFKKLIAGYKTTAL
jgi:hypothetical protein